MLFLDAFTHFLLVKYFNNTIQPNLLTNSIDRLTKKDGPIIDHTSKLCDCHQPKFELHRCF